MRSGAEERLRGLLETVPLYVSELTPDGVILSQNHTHDGLTSEQVVGSHVLNWIPPHGRARMQAAIDAVLAGQRLVQLEIEGSGSDGLPTWYRSSLGPIEVNGQVTAIWLIGEDISLLRRAQIEREREGQLTAIGRVSASIAHDYNTLFTAMLCSLDAARLVANEPELLREELTTLETAVTGAAQLTRHLTRATRVAPAWSERCELSAGLRELAPLLERVAGKSVELRYDLVPGPVYVALHATDLSQLMLNLVINAREAMPEGGSVHVSLALEDGDASSGLYALLRVIDTGPGFPEHVLEHMFDPYFSTKDRGSGFGLATCYGIAAAAGGEIRGVRAPGGGALIEVRLPVCSAPRVASERPPRTQVGTRGATLLLVDDSPELRATLGRHLSRVGFTVLLGCDPRDALEVLHRHPGDVDLVITDVVMPGGSGVGLLRTLRAERPGMRALATTGQQPDKEHAWLREHAVPVLRKPFSARELEKRVRELIG